MTSVGKAKKINCTSYGEEHSHQTAACRFKNSGGPSFNSKQAVGVERGVKTSPNCGHDYTSKPRHCVGWEKMDVGTVLKFCRKHFTTIINSASDSHYENVNVSYSYWSKVSRGSSVSIVTEVRFPAGAENFSLRRRVQTGSVAHLASYSVGTRGSFPGGTATAEWRWPLTSI
jgi:hypothetical protein